MGWRSTTYKEIEQRIRAIVPDIKDMDVYNNQFDHFEREGGNMMQPFRFPNLFVEFSGGQWERTGGVLPIRTAEPYTFRIHIGQTIYTDSHENALHQSIGLEHLDFIEQVINALDHFPMTHVHKLNFVAEDIDHLRSHIIHHILTFEGTVEDCSAQNNLTPGVKAQDERILRKNNNPPD